MRWIVSLLGIILSVSVGAASHFVPQLSHSGELTHAAFSPQGHFIATASEDATVRLWSPQGQIISVLEHPEVVLQTVFLDEQSLVTLDDKGQLRAWQGMSEISVALDGFSGSPASGAVNRLAYHAPSGTLAVAGYRSLQWSALSLSELRGERVSLDFTSLDVSFNVHGMALSPSGKLAALANKEGWLALVDLAQKKIIYQQQLEYGFSSLEFADKERLVLGGDGIVLFSATEQKVTKHWDNSGFWGVFSLAINPVHNEIALLATELQVVDMESGEVRFSVEDMGMQALAWTPDGEMLLAGKGLGSRCEANYSGASLFDRAGQNRSSLPMGFFTSTSVAALAPNNTLAMSHCDHNIQLWALDSLNFVNDLQGHRSGLTDLAFSADSQQLFSTSTDDTLQQWSLATAEAQELARAEGDYFTRVATAPNAYAWGDKADGTSASVWLAQGEEVKRLSQDFKLKIEGLKFVPSSGHLLVLDFEKKLRTFTPDGKKQLLAFEGPGRDRIEHFAVAPDASYLITASGNNLLRWQNLPWQQGAKGKPEVKVTAEAFRVGHMSFSHQGNLLTTVQHQDVVIHATDTLQPVRRIGGLQPQQVFYSDKDQYLVDRK